MAEPKKLALFRMAQIFHEYTDVNHPMKQTEIAARLLAEYGIVMERKAIGRDISRLKEMGFEM